MNLNRDVLRAALRTFMQVWVPLLLVALIGWLRDVQSWLNDSRQSFPHLSPFSKVILSTFIAAMGGTVSLLHNALPWAKQAVYIESRDDVKGKGPENGDDGYYDPVYLIVVVVVLLVLLFVVLRLFG